MKRYILFCFDLTWIFQTSFVNDLLTNDHLSDNMIWIFDQWLFK